MTENLNIPSDDNLKNFNKIIGTLENSLKIDPKDHNLYISLGDEYLKLKRFDSPNSIRICLRIRL